MQKTSYNGVKDRTKQARRGGPEKLDSTCTPPKRAQGKLVPQNAGPKSASEPGPRQSCASE